MQLIIYRQLLAASSAPADQMHKEMRVLSSTFARDGHGNWLTPPFCLPAWMSLMGTEVRRGTYEITSDTFNMNVSNELLVPCLLSHEKPQEERHNPCRSQKFSRTALCMISAYHASSVENLHLQSKAIYYPKRSCILQS